MNSVSDTSSDRAWTWQAGLLLALTLLTFLPSFDAGFVWNDDDLLFRVAIIAGHLSATEWCTTRS